MSEPPKPSGSMHCTAVARSAPIASKKGCWLKFSPACRRQACPRSRALATPATPFAAPCPAASCRRSNAARRRSHHRGCSVKHRLQPHTQVAYYDTSGVFVATATSNATVDAVTVADVVPGVVKFQSMAAAMQRHARMWLIWTT